MTDPQSDLSEAPCGRVSVELPGDATSNVVLLSRYAPAGRRISKTIRWTGSGTATLWFSPASARAEFTASETAASVPGSAGGRQWLKIVFAAQWEEQAVQATHLLSTGSTAGTYVVTF